MAALAAILLILAPATDARTKKGDKLLAQGRTAEDKKQYELALELYEQALSEDPADPGYQLAMRRVRFRAAHALVSHGQKVRTEGRLEEALAVFEKAYAIDPSSSIAEAEVHRTRTMIERAKTAATQEDRGLTPPQAARKEAEERMAAYQSIPELQPLSNNRITLKMNSQPPKVLFETVGKLAGINVIFDPDYSAAGSPSRNYNVELNGTTLEEALDHLSVLTNSFWKPLSHNTIFVTVNNTTKRRDHDEMVMKVFYLTNVVSPQELQEIVTALRTVTDIQKLFTYSSQSAIIVRAEADRVALAEKLIADLDKPRAEVVVDVIVLETSRSKTRDLAAAIAPQGLDVPIFYNGGTTTPPSDDGATPPAGDNKTGSIPLSQLGKLSTGDFSLTLPSALLQAVLSDSNTRILQSPQVRASDGQPAKLNIGDRVPIASGSFQPGIIGGGTGLNPLVNTQFTFQDVGVNVSITPKIHWPEDEVSLHVEIDISNVRDRIDLGGISQPIIGQRKVVHDIRIREGEANVLGGLMQAQDTLAITGIPGLAQIPVLGRLFSSETKVQADNEILIVLVPHIVRTPTLTDSNLKPIAVGNATNVKLSRAPRAEPAKEETPQAPGQAAPAAPPVTAPPPAVAPPAPAPASPATAARISLTPNARDAGLGASVTVSLVVENATDLYSAPIRVRFDPKVVNLVDATAGGLLTGDGQNVVPVKNILNDQGEATITLSRPQGVSGVSGSGVLLNLQFQTVGRGTATVSASPVTLRDSQGRTLAAGAPEMVIRVQ
ncbi:MAG: cohesin domain-containing protein [Bryobacteraceae bacterium]